MKSRIQGAEKIPGVTPKYNFSYPALITIAREEGFAALYKGFVPKVLRLAPGGGVLLLVVELTLGMFRQGMGHSFGCNGSDSIASDSAWTSIHLSYVLTVSHRDTCIAVNDLQNAVQHLRAFHQLYGRNVCILV